MLKQINAWDLVEGYDMIRLKSLFDSLDFFADERPEEESWEAIDRASSAFDVPVTAILAAYHSRTYHRRRGS